jgi:hypothetical protein
MMAISRLRFAPILALVLFLAVLFLAGATILAPEAHAYDALIEQIAPDEDGDGPLASAAGGSSSQNERTGPPTSKPEKAPTLSFDSILFQLIQHAKSLGLL